MCATCLKEPACGLEIIDFSILAAFFFFFSEGGFATCFVSNCKRKWEVGKRTFGILVGYNLLRKILRFALICKDKTNHAILEHSVRYFRHEVRHNLHRLQRNERSCSQSDIRSSHIAHDSIGCL